MLQLVAMRYHMISAGMTTGKDKPTNITKVIKNVNRSLNHCLNNSRRSTFQKLCFFIPQRYSGKTGAVNRQRLAGSHPVLARDWAEGVL